MLRLSSIPLARLATGLALATLAILTLASAGSVNGAQQARKHIVKQMSNRTLGRIVLTNTRHHTLYTLSAEKNGKFICVRTCLGTWAALIIPPATKPTGPVKLGTVARPDGGIQVTYKGRPLYTFRPEGSGQVKGNGFKDVGTWRAATVGKPLPPEPAPEPPQPPSPYPYPY